MATEHVHSVTDDSFDAQVLNSSGVTMVDFWAEWCGPCRMLAPTVESIADEYEGKVKVMKMNVDENPDTPTKYFIKGIPTLIVFRDGKPVEQIVGNQPRQNIVSIIQKHLS